MHMDPLLPRLTLALTLLLGVAMLLRKLRQPAPVVFMLGGILVGPSGFDLLGEDDAFRRIGEFGVILLLFFLGAEISLPSLLRDWRVPVLGTALQIALSVAAAATVGGVLGWSVARIVLLGFVISLSSTALVLNLLEERGERDLPIGKDVIAILLAQDLAIAPMLMILSLLGGVTPTVGQVLAQLVGAIVLLGLVAWVGVRGTIQLPFMSVWRDDEDLQVFGALFLALALATASGACGLSTAFGAFVGGLVVGATEESTWVHRSLGPLRSLLVAVFLMAIGAMVDVGFVLDHPVEVLAMALAALATNTVFNTVILLTHGRPWRRALYGGALLAQIGEFSFVLAAVGVQEIIITEEGYQIAIAVIAATLVLGTPWIGAASRLTRALES